MKNYGVNLEELKALKPKRIVCVRIKGQEQPLLKKNDVVTEICLCEKYQGLTFWDPDNQCQYTVYKKKLEWTHGWTGRWSFICQPHRKYFEDESFLICDMAIGLIAKSEQDKELEIVHNK